VTVLNFPQAMANAKKASFDPLPDGVYDVVCIESVPTESSTNKPMIKLKYQVETGPHAGSKVFNQQVFSADSDAALAIFFRYMAFHGLDEAYFSANPAWEQVAASLVGRRVQLKLGQRVWQGQTRNEVLQVLPAATPGAMGIGGQGTTPQPLTAPAMMQPTMTAPSVVADPSQVPYQQPQVVQQPVQQPVVGVGPAPLQLVQQQPAPAPVQQPYVPPPVDPIIQPQVPQPTLQPQVQQLPTVDQLPTAADMQQQPQQVYQPQPEAPVQVPVEQQPPQQPVVEQPTLPEVPF